ncbi:RadC family protein [Flavobacterium sp. UBA4197]|uniref:RadC family protein n=1 Tax=Flavobacterium sp. UBA4197 TaxID=1946546 RepID=UPI00257F43BB|nr:DNA repair protein RadC [Flavobacterium sp. UBA4197]
MKVISYIPIKGWATDDKPREKLIHKGESVLSDTELLTILIRSGSREVSALEVAKKILSSLDNNLNNLGKLSVKKLMSFKGIGEAKAVTIVAALELGRRRREEEFVRCDKITSSKAVFEIMKPLIGELQHEEFWVIFLNNSNKVISKSQISKGGIEGTIVDARLIFKTALENNATGIILCHNHPSGVLKASEPDKKITLKLKEAGKSLDIKVLDHVIIAERNYYSFLDDGLL